VTVRGRAVRIGSGGPPAADGHGRGWHVERPTDEKGRPLSERRLLENEKLCQRLNRKVEELDRLIAASDGEAGLPDPPGFFCECSDADCLARLPLTLADYDRVHARADQFTLRPGHQVPEVERVVETGDGWLVVQKTAPKSAPEVQA
jgi:hypothetical protein